MWSHEKSGLDWPPQVKFPSASGILPSSKPSTSVSMSVVLEACLCWKTLKHQYAFGLDKALTLVSDHLFQNDQVDPNLSGLTA
jgi:hypothetical protein